MVRPQTATWPWLVRILATFPAALLAAFYLFVLHAHWSLGHWSRPDWPDPKSLGFDLHANLVWVLLLGCPFACLLALFIAFYDYVSARRGFPGRLLVGVVASAALVLVLSVLDPGDFFAWFVD